MARAEARHMEVERSRSRAAWVGTSGFSYRDWKGILYPEWMPVRDWFHYYATRFHAVEINLSRFTGRRPRGCSIAGRDRYRPGLPLCSRPAS